METRQYTVYKFDELSDEGKEKAIDNWRNNCSGYDMEFLFDDLKDELKNPNQLFTELRECDWLTPLLVEMANLKAIHTVEIQELCAYRDTCTIKLTVDEDILIPYVVNQLPFKNKQRLKELYECDAFYLASGDYIAWYGSTGNIGDKIADAWTEVYEEAFKDIRRDIEWYCIKRMQAEEEYLYSDEYIAETLIANEYDFTEDGTCDG